MCCITKYVSHFKVVGGCFTYLLLLDLLSSLKQQALFIEHRSKYLTEEQLDETFKKEIKRRKNSHQVETVEEKATEEYKIEQN